jgi:hypothetical protein
MLLVGKKQGKYLCVKSDSYGITHLQSSERTSSLAANLLWRINRCEVSRRWSFKWIDFRPRLTWGLHHCVQNGSGAHQPPIQWVPGALSLGIKRLGREADRSPPSSSEVKEWVELYLYSPNTPLWRGVKLKNTGTRFGISVGALPSFCVHFFVMAEVCSGLIAHPMSSVACRDDSLCDN